MSSIISRIIFLAIASADLLFFSLSCRAQATTPPQSTFFSTAAEESYSTYQMTAGNGDLWPSCWADDGNLYAANGDGHDFSSTFYSMAVARIAGTPPNLTGNFIAGDVGKNYSGNPYTDKPTGMLCVGGAIYLAFQNLNENTFEDAPAASIVKSTDHGATWSANPAAPMFGTPGNNSDPTAYKFTTIFFLDYGQNYANAIDGYVYAYGLDNNWRGQSAVYLARVPSTSVIDRSTWQFYTGMNGNAPTWSSDIIQKAAVLTDDRELYQTMFGTDCPANQKVIAQGGAVYDAPLHRYIMATWGCATHEFYEAPQPWGPWSHFLSKDFGPLRLTQNRGQYGISIPSKFISDDGLALYVQSNVCCSGDSYTFSLRKLYLEPYAQTSPTNPTSSTNLALSAGTRAISKSTHFGMLCAFNCSDEMASPISGASEDDFDEENKLDDGVESYWGYIWPQAYNINQVTYTTGSMFPDGGWFNSDLRVQVRQNFEWVDVADATVSPAYSYNNQIGAQTAYTFRFPATWGDGVRIIGVPGGTSYFTSIHSLAAYYANAAPSGAAGFTLGINPTSLPVTSGASGSATISITPVNGFNQQVSFSCSGLPAQARCNFSPDTVTPNGTGASSTTVSITTSASSSASTGSRAIRFRAGTAVVFCLFLLPTRRSKRRGIAAGLLLFATICATLVCSACSGGSSTVANPGTPKGTSAVTITATSGSRSSAITQTVQLSLTVQ
ncbi:MAG: DUF4185 domain-containing protein [Terracidiphilus sp.]